MTKDTGTGFGAGKVILFGEHAVVYGEPALAAGLAGGAEAKARYRSDGHQLRVVGADDGIDVTLTGPSNGYRDWWRAFIAGVGEFDSHLAEPVSVEVRIDIPMGVGLGSSAALGTAVARALADLTGESDLVDDAVTATEEVFHGDPSGIDQLVAKRGGVRFFRKDEPEAPALDIPPIELAVCRAANGAPTSEMVGGVRELKGREPELTSHILTWIGDVSRKASEALRAGDAERVGELMNMNHGALVSLGVSTRALDSACHVAREAGAYGAKLTGAGGGGCAIAVVSDETSDRVVDAWENEGHTAFTVTLGVNE